MEPGHWNFDSGTTMIVDLGDGRVVDFGDLPEAKVTEALKKLAPPQQEVRAAPEQKSGLDRYVSGALSSVGKGVATALGIPGDIQALGQQVNPFGLWKGDSEERTFPTSGELVEKGGRAGLWDRADMIPQNWGERYTSGALEGLGSALPQLALPGGPVTKGLQLAAGAAGGLAGTGASEGLPNSPMGLAPVVAWLATGGGLNAAIRGIPRASMTYPANALAKAAGGLIGAGSGYLLGGVESGVLGTLLGELAGPPIAAIGRGAAATVKNPLVPAAGAIGGSTALFPPAEPGYPP
jgi:hypothetical protein